MILDTLSWTEFVYSMMKKRKTSMNFPSSKIEKVWFYFCGLNSWQSSFIMFHKKPQTWKAGEGLSKSMINGKVKHYKSKCMTWRKNFYKTGRTHSSTTNIRFTCISRKLLTLGFCLKNFETSQRNSFHILSKPKLMSVSELSKRRKYQNCT